jgi:hypothetical protein
LDADGKPMRVGGGLSAAEAAELQRGLPPVARPYLYTLAELDTATPSEERPEAEDFALKPNQNLSV